MSRTWVISDTHFGHHNICKFINNDGSKLRPFDNADVMDECLIDNWNSVVTNNDKVYHLGDVAMNKKSISTIARCNGRRKILIKGNHDIFKLNDYIPYFDDIRACHVLNKIVFSHIPIHSESADRFKKNVHGHTHGNFVLDSNGNPDKFYINVCVEHTNYTPIDIEEIFERASK